MRIYNVLGYSALALQLVLSAWLAPPSLGPWWGMAIGFGYLVLSWFLAGVYLSDVMHMGITHGGLDYKEWFIKGVTLLNNTLGVYVDPVSWVNRHRLHHRFADHHGDPNKLDGDGFWTTLYRCMFPYKTTMNVADDDILQDVAVPSGVASAVHGDLAGVELRFPVVVRARLALRHRRVAGHARVRAVGEHGPELLDARSPLGHEALRRSRRQRDEHRRLAAGDGDVQRLLAEQPSPLSSPAPHHSRSWRVRLRLHDGPGHAARWDSSSRPATGADKPSDVALEISL